MTIHEFVENYKNKRFIVAKQGVDERAEWIKKEISVKPYVSFREKRKIAEMVVAKNIKEVDGIKKYDSIDGYISIIVTSIMAHTNLEWSSDPVADYDLLAESGLLPQIIAQFQSSHDEIDLLRKMVLEMELEDNQVSAFVGRFLNKISGALDGVANVAKDKLESIDLKGILGADFNEEDITQLMSTLNKLK